MRVRAVMLLLGVGGCGGVGLTAYETGGGGGEGAVELVVVPKGTTDFGDVELETTAVETFTMSTTGDQLTAILDIRFDEEITSDRFTLADSTLTFPRPLQAGTSLTVDVEFTPLYQGSYGGTLVIEYEADAQGTVATVERKMTGYGCQPSACD